MEMNQAQLTRLAQRLRVVQTSCRTLMARMEQGSVPGALCPRLTTTQARLTGILSRVHGVKWVLHVTRMGAVVYELEELLRECEACVAVDTAYKAVQDEILAVQWFGSVMSSEVHMKPSWVTSYYKCLQRRVVVGKQQRLHALTETVLKRCKRV